MHVSIAGQTVGAVIDGTIWTTAAPTTSAPPPTPHPRPVPLNVQRYLPFGGIRGSSGHTQPTDRGYTGQPQRPHRPLPLRTPATTTRPSINSLNLIHGHRIQPAPPTGTGTPTSRTTHSATPIRPDTSTTTPTTRTHKKHTILLSKSTDRGREDRQAVGQGVTTQFRQLLPVARRGHIRLGVFQRDPAVATSESTFSYRTT